MWLNILKVAVSIAVIVLSELSKNSESDSK